MKGKAKMSPHEIRDDPNHQSTKDKQRVFISYKRGSYDEEVASRLYTDLTGKNFDVFHDKQPAGVDFEKAASEFLDQADYVIALISAASIESGFIRAELERAYDLRLKFRSPIIIPIRLAYSGPLGLRLGALLGRFQYIFLSDLDDYSALIEMLQRALGIPESSILSTYSSIYELSIIDTQLYRTLIKYPDLLRSLEWRTFERLLADILESLGYEIELQQGSKDGGIDLFAVKRYDTFGLQRFLLQAKRWSHKVGIESVRQLTFLHSHHRVTKSCLATTATFTRGAWELANHYQWQLELRDFQGIQEWINEVANKRLK